MPKTQHLTINLIAPTTVFWGHRKLIDQFIDNHCCVEWMQLHQVGQQHSIIMVISGTWEQVAKIELQLKQYQKEQNVCLSAQRGEHHALAKSECMAYELEILCLPQQDVGMLFCDFFQKQDIHLIAHVNQTSHNQFGTLIRALTYRLAVPCDSDFMLLHEEINELLDEHQLDGEFRLVRDI